PVSGRTNLLILSQIETLRGYPSPGILNWSYLGHSAYGNTYKGVSSAQSTHLCKRALHRELLHFHAISLDRIRLYLQELQLLQTLFPKAHRFQIYLPISTSVLLALLLLLILSLPFNFLLCPILSGIELHLIFSIFIRFCNSYGRRYPKDWPRSRHSLQKTGNRKDNLPKLLWPALLAYPYSMSICPNESSHGAESFFLEQLQHAIATILQVL